MAAFSCSCPHQYTIDPEITPHAIEHWPQRVQDPPGADPRPDDQRPGHLGLRLELDGETIDLIAEMAAVHLPVLVDGSLVTACLVRCGTSAGTPWMALALHPAPDRPTSWFGRRAAGKPLMDAQPCAAAPAQESSR